MKHVPNIITSLNLSSGFFAIIYAFNGDLLTSSWLIVAAMIFDFFDGFSARMLKAYSDMGKELDSLADVVSFGVAPAIIIFELLRQSLPETAAGQNSGILFPIILYVPVIMPVCAALRLARFNIDTEQTTSFRGMPTPANAIAVISVVIASLLSDSPVMKSFTGSPAALLIFTIILSLLMVTRIPLLSLKTSHLKLKGNEGRYILVVLVLIASLVLGISAAPLIIPLYIVASLLSLIFRVAPSVRK